MSVAKRKYVEIELNAQAMEIAWNPNNKKEESESKVWFQKAQAELRNMIDQDGKEVAHFIDVKNTGMFVIKEISLTDEDKTAIRILNEEGDETRYWKASDPDQVKEAEKIFTEYLVKGWKAYAVKADGSKGRRIRKFDATKEEIVFHEGAAMKLKEFAKTFKKTEMIPATRPG